MSVDVVFVVVVVVAAPLAPVAFPATLDTQVLSAPAFWRQSRCDEDALVPSTPAFWLQSRGVDDADGLFSPPANGSRGGVMRLWMILSSLPA